MEYGSVIDFLIEAKKATYAGNGPQSASSRPSSRDLEYAKGTLRYIDTYLGSEKFAGEEALWEDGKPFWAMNYVGRVIAEGFSGDFLKDALSRAAPDMPYRGPGHFADGPFRYRCEVDGTFDWFSGREFIFLGETKVYECLFHGGLIR
ncbi:DUF5680 domain-containing protein [Paenibacillus flagellatus]|uniref:DUF5680 domain-containing protein n=1 Tax=Paenibacillus flagellatus TaxID=2211139 RepID=A0A2V5KBQ7_9BACL|nr:DUF5680 domain-containing protein [Paenibacillus flagellatus]PYI56412.1 hypothetical protein DLM86_05390 [Paenibacillus flagellatus]